MIIFQKSCTRLRLLLIAWHDSASASVVEVATPRLSTCLPCTRDWLGALMQQLQCGSAWFNVETCCKAALALAGTFRPLIPKGVVELGMASACGIWEFNQTTHRCSESGPISWKPPRDSHRPVSLQQSAKQAAAAASVWPGASSRTRATA